MTEAAERPRRLAYWPTATQERLLAAAFGPDDVARGEWDGVRPTLDLDRLEPGTFGLMPLLYRRLEAWGVSDVWLGRLKGLYRHTWSRNQLFLARIRALAEAFHERSLDVLLAGGPLLATKFYEDLGSRPTDRADFIVRPEQLRAAAEAAHGAGWPATDQAALEQLEHRSATWFGDGRGSFVVLHRARDEDWDDAGVVELEAWQCRTVTATRQLRRTCAGDERHYRWGRAQWVADVHMLARSGSVDWKNVADRSGALAYVREVAFAPIPPEVAGGKALVAVRRLAFGRR